MVLHGHVVQGADPRRLVAGFRLGLALASGRYRWRRRAGRHAVGGSQGLLYGLLHQRLHVQLGRGGRRGLLGRAGPAGRREKAVCISYPRLDKPILAGFLGSFAPCSVSTLAGRMMTKPLYA